MAQTLISPLAQIDPEAQIGAEVTIGPFVTIEANTVVGDRTVLDQGCIIRSGARIGSDCHIHPYAVIAGIPQDLKFKGEETTAVIGNHTTIREFATVNRGTASRGTTVIGSNCLIMAYSHVAHDCILKDHIILGNATQLAGEVEIDDYAILSGAVLVHQFVRISQHVMIQGGSKVTKDIPPYCLVGRDPIVYCGINIVGLRRRGFTNEQIFLINDIYRTLYQGGLNNSEALVEIQSRYPQGYERDLIYNFISDSKRGIVRGSMD